FRYGLCNLAAVSGRRAGHRSGCILQHPDQAARNTGSPFRRTGDLSISRVRRGRRRDELRQQSYSPIPAAGPLRRSDPQGGEAGRPTGPAGHKGGVDPQPQGRQRARRYRAAAAAWPRRRGDRMKRRDFITLLGSAAAWPLAARAQQGERMRRIGVLMSAVEGDPRALEFVTAFAQGLAELGWTVGRNVRIEYRWGAGDLDR